MMSFATKHTADHQNNLCPGFHSPAGPHGLDALARYGGRVEALDVDARRHDRDALPRRAIAFIDDLGDLVAHRDDAIAPRHHAVVDPFERILLSKGFVPGGEEGYAVDARGNIGAPRGRAAMCMDNVATARPDNTCERDRIAQHGEWIFAGDIDVNEFAARGRDVVLHSSAARYQYGLVTGGSQNTHELDGP